MQASVLEGDGQAKTRASGGAGTRRVRPPETGEDHRGLTRAQPDPVVLDDDGHGTIAVAQGAR